MPELDIQGILAGSIAKESSSYANALGLGGNWVLRTRLGRFDIMQWIGEDALWEKLSPAAIDADIDDLRIRVISYEDLVTLKEKAGRPEDLADLQRLRQARDEAV